MKIPFTSFHITKRSSLSNPSDNLVNWLTGGTTSKAGADVSEDTAMQIMAVKACVRLNSETMASLPFGYFKYLKKGKERADYASLYRVIHDIANPEMTSFEFRRMMAVNELLCGEAFAEIVRDPITLEVKELWPIPNNYVTIYYYTETRRLAFYRIALPNGGYQDLYPEQVWHWKGLARDSTRRYKPIQLARETLGLAIAAEEYGERFFSNGTNVGGVIEYAGGMQGEAAKRFRESIREKYEGLSKANRLIFLENGSKFTAVNTPNDKAQFIDTRKFQIIEICRHFNVPPHMIHELDRATFNNIEHMSIGFVVYSLRPWLVCIEQSAFKDLLLPGEQKKYFFKFNVDGLLRGDFKTRMDGYAVARQNGWLSADDIRELEDMNPLPEGQGGDLYLVNGNMLTAKQAAEKGGNNGA